MGGVLMGGYTLRCLAGGEILPENYTLSCPEHPGFIRTDYAVKQISFRENEPGLFRYMDWLPVHTSLPTRTEPVTFQSGALSRELGLPNLWVTFTGWYPERGCFAKTGSFKELEALPTLVRLRENGGGTLVVASAGNTGRAFAQMGADFGMPVVLVVPASSADKIWTVSDAVPESVRLVTVNGDYSDAIFAADSLCRRPGYFPEGGGKNVARRDGMGTVMLSAARAIGHMPDHYVQAVGSGTGGIAAWEAAMRLAADGRFGSRLPNLHLAQNLPFVPMVRAWKRRSQKIEDGDMPADAAAAVREVSAQVLTNRFPPYSVKGGVFDSLSACGGDMYAVSNAEAADAAKLFADAENGTDLDPAAAVALAALRQAVSSGAIQKSDTVALNCTGGGYARIAKECRTVKIPVCLNIQPGEEILL
ncbi:MAG: cysteate synthase [Methanocorpusculum sp.]|nr:cysteate synthase [Methanocorpusculum sp.]